MDTTTATSTLASPASRRINSIDVLRGLAMAIMALDHTRDYFYNNAFMEDPMDYATTYPALFFTRWVTHFCAPVFVLLAGTSIYLQSLRKPKAALARYLLVRGGILFLLEFTVINFGWFFNIGFHSLVLQVIGTLGLGMVLMAGLIYWPMWAIAAFGFIIVAGHNLFDGVHAPQDAWWRLPWSLLHESNFFPFGANRGFFNRYPILPWVGLMACGYVLGQWFRAEVAPADRFKKLMLWGAGLTVLFIALRYVNAYGNPRPWHIQRSELFTALDFFNTEKYPPSLQFLLMTIGPSLIALALLERWPGRWQQPLKLLGTVPLFFYILHIYLIHALLLVAVVAVGGDPSVVVINFAAPIDPNAPPPQGSGIYLPGTYAIWLLVVAICYAACTWYARIKAKHPASLLRYL
jgi:uncharacterized membrane protein